MAKDKKMVEGQLDLFQFMTTEPKEITSEEIEKEELELKLKPGGFKECKSCWCLDCKHNVVNEGVPRDLCGQMLPCPACSFCVENGQAEICKIGSAKEGCSVRAAEESVKSASKSAEYAD